MEFDFNNIDDDFIVEGIDAVPADQIKYAWNMGILTADVTHLKFGIYVNEIRQTDFPLTIFIPDAYSRPSTYYALVVSENPEFLRKDAVQHIQLKHIDILNAIRFVKANVSLLHNLANGETSIGELNYDAEEYGDTPVKPDYLLKEEPMTLNEMANIRRSVTGLPCDIWLDLSGSWRSQSGHGFRVKVEDPKTKIQLPVTFPELEYVKGTGSLKANDIKEIELWFWWNSDIIEETMFTALRDRDLRNTLLQYMKSGIPLTLTGKNIISTQKITYDYTVIKKAPNDTYNVLVNNRLISKQWFTEIGDAVYDYDVEGTYLPVKYTTVHGKAEPEYVKHTGKLYLDGTLVETNENMKPFNRKRKR